MRIDWAEPALKDLEEIRNYISRDAEFYAIRFIERVIEAVESLEKFPERGRRVPEAADESIRELLFQNYRIIYRAETERVLILTVIHGGRDLSRVNSKKWNVD